MAINGAVDHIGVFFASFPQYNYNPHAPIWAEFDHLAIHQGWGGWRRRRQNASYKAARKRFSQAMILEFNHQYGTDEKSLQAWQGLCRAVGVVPPPPTITQCRKAIKAIHVNICDLVDFRRMEGDGYTVEKYESVGQLKQYSKKSHKIFPKEDAKAGGLLKHLLRTFDHKK